MIFQLIIIQINILRVQAERDCRGTIRISKADEFWLNTVHDLTEDSILEPELQNFHERPILLGADVEALYPNMERTSTGGLVYQAAIESDMKFQGIE